MCSPFPVDPKIRQGWSPEPIRNPIETFCPAQNRPAGLALRRPAVWHGGMRLLVLGGTVFLSRAVAREAVARGHDVTCAARGTSGSVPDGARLVTVDRAAGLPAIGGEFDAVVDVARQPSWVRAAVAAYPDAHWVFVSTVNVYADDATPGGTPATLPLVEAQEEDVDLAEHPEAYGPMKVACERAVRDGAASAMVVRPGLIVGPEDPTGRFTYWPRRLAAGGEVLAPGDPDDVMQVVDVRDLAAWIVTACEQRTTGTYDGVGEPQPMRELLTGCAQGVDAEVALTWVPQEFLQEQGVEPWAGPDGVPLWLPRPEYDGLPAHDVRPSLDAGLTLRPLAETTRDTVAWLAATPDATVTGISAERERELLDAWRARG
jgi:2'-hydroxyisoflavone reductase